MAKLVDWQVEKRGLVADVQQDRKYWYGENGMVGSS